MWESTRLSLSAPGLCVLPSGAVFDLGRLVHMDSDGHAVIDGVDGKVSFGADDVKAIGDAVRSLAAKDDR